MGPHYDTANIHPLARQPERCAVDPMLATKLPPAPSLRGEGYLTLLNILLAVLILG